MPYKTYADQLLEHLTFLQAHGLDVTELAADAGFIRCRPIGETRGRGELSYKTTSSILNNGLFGLVTWCRGDGGDQDIIKTYGLGPNGDEVAQLPASSAPAVIQSAETYESASRSAYGFWNHSQVQGESDYLKRKGVGYHGIRFRSSKEFGNVAVVPMVDIDGNLWNYQLLNSDGSKRFGKGGRTHELFHSLRPIVNGSAFGVAESYVTAATCMENTGIPCFCAFSCNNIKDVVCALASKYTDSRIVIFADNDRHLPVNQGMECAKSAAAAVGQRATVAAPDFGDRLPSKDESDWNDLLRILGIVAFDGCPQPTANSRYSGISNRVETVYMSQST